ncbi:Tex-like N-terminal domain-containing protein [Paludisphaera borealis]|uniref:30S ribosomal protein S1 n=1 Tax=Paludisphaera borealis TaxID=1387353 RepID=A0A1U7CQ87_9BACT|nr:Tex-like N-terminal domain-containing protein [Paludisphaera borealis]APW61110.1 30S ribosomal protein S1 [Paludisphaera borealis]
MDNPIQVDLGRIAQDLQIRRVQVESVVQLLDEGNTVPFITRYRKERTGNLNEVVIREIQLRVQRLRELAERKETILKAIEKQEKLDPELAAAIRAAESLKRLEDLYLPFKPKKRTKASEAREKGLEPLALRVWNRDETLTDLTAAAQEFIDAEKGLETAEKVLEGVGYILAEAISEMASVRDAVRKTVWKTGKVVTTKGEVPEGQGLEYRDYFDYSEPLAQVPPHRVLAINRGDKEGPLKVKLEVPRPDLEAAFMGQLPLDAHPQGEIFHAAALDSLDRLILPSMEREVRRDLTEAAEKHAVDVFARNLRSLLLQPPIPKQVVLAIDPGLRSGCKLAVLDPNGNLLDQAIVYPHAPQGRRSEAKLFIKDLVGKYNVGVVAIGNGTACRETEEMVAEIIAEGVEFSQNPEARAAAEAAAATATVTAPAEPAVAIETPEAEAVVAPDVSEHQAHPHADAVEPEPAHEQPIEDLPPISGGAPDSASSESSAETETASAESPSTNHQAHPTEEAGHDAPPPAAESHAHAVRVEAPAEPALEAPAAEPALEAPAAEPALEAPSQASGDTPATEGGEAAAAPTPAKESRRGRGEGRSRGSRSRSSQSTPPPQTPPAPHSADPVLAQLAYVIVNEAGASVYSASPIGREELPDFDATLRSAISIGRRLQDPLSELVKIEPQNIGVGLYQHDVSPKQLKDSLDAVISSCVNFVGVDLNTASVPLLRYVSGLNQLTARRIADRRKEKGAFATRDELIEVEGVGAATFTQAAGFLKIGEGPHPLDRTWVHPESYEAATRLLQTFGYEPEVVRDKEKLPELRTKLAEADVAQISKDLEIGEFTLRDIIEALGRPERDPRDDLPKPIFKKGILKLEDLAAGMELKGTVLNVVDFGAFVDIGLKDSGLVHISQLANRYIKSPHDVVSVGDVVTVWVMSVDQDRKRVSLTMVKPGTERHRGAGGGGPGGGPGRRGEGQPQGQGEGRRGRGPRPSGSALTSPPVGVVPSPTPGEGAPRRFDRDRPAPSGGPGPGRGEGRPQGGSGGGRPGGGPGQGRGGPRGGSYGSGGGRFGPGRPGPGADRGPAPAPRPARPAPPPPPLSKDAIAGSVPLRTFGQLKQLWETRVDEPDAPAGSEPGAERHSSPAEQPKPDATSPAHESGAE